MLFLTHYQVKEVMHKEIFGGYTENITHTLLVFHLVWLPYGISHLLVLWTCNSPDIFLEKIISFDPSYL